MVVYGPLRGPEGPLFHGTFAAYSALGIDKYASVTVSRPTAKTETNKHP
jgi:hypothetical protein